MLHLRETATKMGLLRKHRGMLLATPRGRALRGDPAGLWWHLAERMPPKSTDRCEVQAGLLLLAAVAAQVPGDADAFLARMLGGYRNDRHGPGLGEPTLEGITFARAAVRTWPS